MATRRFKVFDWNEEKQEAKFIFHGVDGQRVIPTGRWLQAIKKPVTDGSGSTIYVSGFHVFSSIYAVAKWAQSLKHTDNRIVVEVRCKEVRPKSHSWHGVELADFIQLSARSLRNRRLLSDILK